MGNFLISILACLEINLVAFNPLIDCSMEGYGSLYLDLEPEVWFVDGCWWPLPCYHIKGMATLWRLHRDWVLVGWDQLTACITYAVGYSIIIASWRLAIGRLCLNFTELRMDYNEEWASHQDDEQYSRMISTGNLIGLLGWREVRDSYKISLRVLELQCRKSSWLDLIRSVFRRQNHVIIRVNVIIIFGPLAGWIWVC